MQAAPTRSNSSAQLGAAAINAIGASRDQLAATRAAPSAAAVSLLGAQQNHVLNALSAADLTQLFGELELVTLHAGKRLFDLGSVYDYTYFPTTAIVSLMYITDDGDSTEIAIVGREGAVGLALYDGERATCCALVQAGGYAFRLRTSALRAAFQQAGALADLMCRYTSALMNHIAQNIVASRHCSIEQKLARVLLERMDRSLSAEIGITQDAMASLLGMRRESVTLAAQRMQDHGLIRYSRGTVAVLDRSALERHAGPCYMTARAGFDQLKNVTL